MGRRYREPIYHVQLGDTAEKVLSTVGITKERVERWLGFPCGCKERQAKWNLFGNWVEDVVRGGVDKAREAFHKMTGSGEEK